MANTMTPEQQIAAAKASRKAHFKKLAGLFGTIAVELPKTRVRVEQSENEPEQRPPATPDLGIPEACEVLGISGEMTPVSVRAAYRKAIAQWHPDRVEGLAPELVRLATQRTCEINQAYELLLGALSR